MAQIKFWDGMNQAGQLDLIDKIMVGVNADGSTKYANIQQLRLLLSTVAQAPIPVDTGFDFGNADDGVYVPTENGTYDGVNVNLSDGFILLTKNGNSLVKTTFPLDLFWYAKQSEVDLISSVIQAYSRFQYDTLPYKYYNNADNSTFLTSSADIDAVTGPASDVLENKATNQNIAYFNTGATIESTSKAVVLSARIISVGSGGGSIGVGYMNSAGDRAFLLRSTSVNADIIRTAPRTTTVIEARTNPKFQPGDIVRIEVYFTGTSSSEQVFRFYLNGEYMTEVTNTVGYDFESTPGAWAIVLRGEIKAEVAKLSYYEPKIVTTDYIDKQLHPSQPVLLNWAVLPDGAGGAPSGGFTCTGLDRITRGTYAGCWLVGNDGRTVQGDASPYDPHVYIMDRDFRRILKSMPMPYSGASVQGVAVDTSGSEDTFWIATAGDGKIRHFDLDGDEITGDVFDWATEYPGLGNPNGLAYDPDNDALWCSDTDGNAKLISCNPVASPRELGELSLTNSPDMLQYINGRLYYSWGNNGSNGNISACDIENETISVLYSSISNAQAIEGIYIDRQNSELTILSDGGFHTQANPSLNIYLKYRI